MKRRDLLRAAAVVVAVPGALAQPARRTPARVAILDESVEATRRTLWASFRARLAELGYVEGRDLIVEARFGNGDPARLAALAAETVAAQPDVVVTVTTGGGLAMKQATTAIPVVVIGAADPVKSGLVASLARPGGNLTGLSPNQAAIVGKWLELVQELLPAARRLVYLTDTGNPGEMLVYRDLAQRAQSRGLDVQVLNGIDPARLDEAFAAMKARRPDAMIVATTASLVPHRQRIVDDAARLRLPAIYARQEYPEVGGLVSYGADSRALWLRAAEYVDRLLRGSVPSELPFEMASTFRLVLNPATVRKLGLAVPDSVRLRADAVIE